MSLYDPERLKQPQRHFFNKERSNKEQAEISFKKQMKLLFQNSRKEKELYSLLLFLSPSANEIINHFQRVFKFKHYSWNSLSLDEVSRGQRTCYGKSLVPSYSISKARFIFSLNCDFLGTYLSPSEFQKQFAETRKPSKQMSRLVVLESLMTLTDLMPMRDIVCVLQINF